MTAVQSAPTPSRSGLRLSRKYVAWIVVAVVVLVALVFGTKRVDLNSSTATGVKKFSAAAWGKQNFAKVQQAITKRAVPAATLAKAVAADVTAAGKKYGVAAGAGPEISASFTGVAGKPDSGIYPVKVAGLPKTLLIRIQGGPAINGTDLRDAPGNIQFGQFTNQIDYQNAASALNNELKTTVLAKAGNLTGKTISVVGAFQLINPNGWLITPATLTVK